MTTTKTLSRRANSRFKVIAVMVSLLVASSALALILPVSEENKAMIVSGVYAVLVTGFLIAQFWGFVVSQTEYSDSIEAPKFAVLKNEDSEWED